MVNEDLTNDTSRETPPAYPYPDDDVLWHSASDGFTVGEDSYFALSRLPDDDVRVFNGREHRNPYRLVIHTPVRGSFAMYVNLGDLQALLAICAVGVTDDDSGMHGDEGEFILFDEWLEGMSGVDVEFVRGEDKRNDREVDAESERGVTDD